MVPFPADSFPSMYIHTYDALREDPHLCATVLERFWKLGQKNVFQCFPETTGRHIWIGSNVLKPFSIHLCEVQVNGVGKTTAPVLVCPNKAVTQLQIS